MPLITDWLMVGITAIYVVATVFICIYNGRSAKATREQVSESQRQYEETKRLEMMPYLQFESTDHSPVYEMNLILVSGDLGSGTYITKLRMKNIGHGTAKDISYVYEWNNFSEKYKRSDFPVKALQSGDEQYIKINFALPQHNQGDIKVAFELLFTDLLEHKYSQRIEFYFRSSSSGVANLKLTEYKTFSPKFMEEEKDA